MPDGASPEIRRFHASLNVSNLQRSVDFYRVLLGCEPVKQRVDYAKFEIADPPLVLSLIPGQASVGGSLNHVGLRVRDAEELVEIQHRLEAAGMPTEREDGVECCYARQTKFWISDPDRALWEVYVFHEDIPERGDSIGPRIHSDQSKNHPVTAVREVMWEHRLQDEVPSRIPHDDNSVHSVRLSGTINARPESIDLAHVLAEAFRTLRPGGRLLMHGLAGDRPSGAVRGRLPGPAAAVEYVPATREVIEAVRAAGFVSVNLETLSRTAHFTVDGVPMRELLATASKPGFRPKTAAHHAVYLGPFAQVTDDFGNVFRQGELTPLNIHDWQTLSKSVAANQLLLLAPGDVPSAACCAEEEQVVR